MATYRVVEITEVTASSEQEAADRVLQGLEGETIEVGVSLVSDPDPKPEGPGCPNCGRDDAIVATANAVGSVDLTIRGPYMDDLEWGALEDVEIGDAGSVRCRACGWYAVLDDENDDLYTILNLQVE